ncbi:MAG: CorA family divalent cation transporter, partial [Candidatus Latescibacterota bacterium]
MMRKLLQTKAQKAGLPPGSLIYVGEKQVEEPLITVFDYTESDFWEIIAESAEDTFPFRDGHNVSWINVSRVSDVDAVERIGGHFRIHPLILEDIVTQGQRPKMEDTEDFLFIILNMLSFDEENGRIRPEQVSMVVGSTWLITFQEIEG